jgi:hypothetical protein
MLLGRGRLPEQTDLWSVQSTAANSTFGSSWKTAAASLNSGLAFLQWPHLGVNVMILLTFSPGTI